METDGRQQAAVLDALGDRTRRAIVDLLVEGPRAVAELAEELPVGRPAVSLHLKVLREAGLVRDKAVGTRRIYSIDPRGIEVLRAYLDRVWQGALANFSAIGIVIGGIGSMVPERRDEIVALGLKSVFAGTLATCMSGTLIGILTNLSENLIK